MTFELRRLTGVLLQSHPRLARFRCPLKAALDLPDLRGRKRTRKLPWTSGRCARCTTSTDRRPGCSTQNCTASIPNRSHYSLPREGRMSFLRLPCVNCGTATSTVRVQDRQAWYDYCTHSFGSRFKIKPREHRTASGWDVASGRPRVR
mgnify:CR=1 FL=1